MINPYLSSSNLNTLFLLVIVFVVSQEEGDSRGIFFPGGGA